MGTRAVIGERYCADGLYVSMDGYPESIEKALGEMGTASIEAAAKAYPCRRDFCTGEHTLEAFWARPWGMHPEWHYYLGVRGEPRAVFTVKTMENTPGFGEDHSLRGWIFGIRLPARRRREAEAASRKEADRAGRRQARLRAEMEVDIGEAGEHSHWAMNGVTTTICGVPNSRVTVERTNGDGFATCPECKLREEYFLAERQKFQKVR